MIPPISTLTYKGLSYFVSSSLITVKDSLPPGIPLFTGADGLIVYYIWYGYSLLYFTRRRLYGCRSVTARKYFVSYLHAYQQLANKDKGLRNSFHRAYQLLTESTSTIYHLEQYIT